MPTQQSIIDELLDRLARAGRVTARKMFGEYCLYLDDKPVALVCDDTLYVKSTAAGHLAMPNTPEGPPYPNAKPHMKFPPESWDDREALCALLRITFDELPEPKTKKRKA